MPATPRQLLDRFQQAMLDFSPDALADLFAHDAIYEFPFLAPQRQVARYVGREEIRAGFAQVWTAVSPSPLVGIRDVRVHDTSDPEVLIAEREIDGINHATGKTFTSAFLLVLRARDGQIVHLRDYSDALAVSAGLDRLPQLLDQLRTEPAAYALSEMRPRDPTALDQYRTLAAESITLHGGRYLVRGGAVETAEGEWPADASVVLVEFPSHEHLQNWYRSADYANALAVRDAALDRQLLFLRGVEPKNHSADTPGPTEDVRGPIGDVV